jgi:hypothetical protein
LFISCFAVLALKVDQETGVILKCFHGKAFLRAKTIIAEAGKVIQLKKWTEDLRSSGRQGKLGDRT